MDSAAYQPAPPPTHSSHPPPPPRGGAAPRFQRSHVPDAAASAPPPPPPPSQPPQVPVRRQLDASRGAGSGPDGKRPQRPSLHPHSRPSGAPPPAPPSSSDTALDDSPRSDKSDNLNVVIPIALTEDAVARAFGNVGVGNGAAPATSPSPGQAGGSRARPGSGRAGGLVMPSRKEGSDSVSMYSMSQSVLPMDPRERIYYRPRRHLLQCYVERRKQKGLGLASLLPGSHRSFHFFLDHTNDFVLAAVPRTMKSRTMVEDTSDGVGGQFYPISQGGANIIFTINQQQLDGDARSFVGKLSRRGSGLEVVLFSEGGKESRKEIMAVLLDNFADTSRSSFTVLLPAIDAATGFIKPLEGGEVKFLRDGRGGTSVAGGSRAGIDDAIENSSEEDVDAAYSTLSRAAPNFAAVPGAPAGPEKQKKWRSHGLLVKEYRRNPSSPNLVVLRNKAPEWDGVLRGYKLDFHGRASKASEKNFQLVAATDPSKVVMLFGKQSDDRFALDFRYPLCGLQAAAIATTIMTVRKVLH